MTDLIMNDNSLFHSYCLLLTHDPIIDKIGCLQRSWCRVKVMSQIIDFQLRNPKSDEIIWKWRYYGAFYYNNLFTGMGFTSSSNNFNEEARILAEGRDKHFATFQKFNSVINFWAILKFDIINFFLLKCCLLTGLFQLISYLSQTNV